MSAPVERTAPVPAPASRPALEPRVLLVEDTEDDVAIFRRLLGKVSAAVNLDIAIDGEAALHWLEERLAAAAAGRAGLPRAIFVDVHLPGMSGFEVVRWIRSRPALDSVFVAMCSGSADERHAATAAALHANVFVPKYPSPDRLAALMAVERA